MTETMTLKELSESMRRRVFAKGDPYDQAAVALRSYAELVAALEWLDGPGNAFIDSTSELTVQPQRAVDIARDLGWPGLEEL